MNFPKKLCVLGELCERSKKLYVLGELGERKKLVKIRGEEYLYNYHNHSLKASA